MTAEVAASGVGGESAPSALSSDVGKRGAPTDEPSAADLVQRLVRRHRVSGTAQFEEFGRSWVVLDGVFSPAVTPATALFTGWIPYPYDGAFLEVGCGTGVTSVVAALAGCAQVTAVDINPIAVENTRLNAERHGVADRVEALESDLFDVLSCEDRYDVIYWNSNFLDVPAEFVHETPLHHAFFDPEYAVHRRFVNEAPGYLAAGGRLLLGFSDLGSWPRLRAACAAVGSVPTVLRAAWHANPLEVEFQLVEIEVQ